MAWRCPLLSHDKKKIMALIWRMFLLFSFCAINNILKWNSFTIFRNELINCVKYQQLLFTIFNQLHHLKISKHRQKVFIEVVCLFVCLNCNFNILLNLFRAIPYMQWCWTCMSNVFNKYRLSRLILSFFTNILFFHMTIWQYNKNSINHNYNYDLQCDIILA